MAIQITRFIYETGFGLFDILANESIPKINLELVVVGGGGVLARVLGSYDGVSICRPPAQILQSVATLPSLHASLQD